MLPAHMGVGGNVIRGYNRTLITFSLDMQHPYLTNALCAECVAGLPNHQILLRVKRQDQVQHIPGREVSKGACHFCYRQGGQAVVYQATAYLWWCCTYIDKKVLMYLNGRAVRHASGSSSCFSLNPVRAT